MPKIVALCPKGVSSEGENRRKAVRSCITDVLYLRTCGLSYCFYQLPSERLPTAKKTKALLQLIAASSLLECPLVGHLYSNTHFLIHSTGLLK